MKLVILKQHEIQLFFFGDAIVASFFFFYRDMKMKHFINCQGSFKIYSGFDFLSNVCSTAWR